MIAIGVTSRPIFLERLSGGRVDDPVLDMDLDPGLARAMIYSTHTHRWKWQGNERVQLPSDSDLGIDAWGPDGAWGL